jgi:hypothetical protein
MQEGMTGVRFAELESVCKALLTNVPAESTPMDAVSVADKMAANDLTEDVAYRMRLGLMQAAQVSEYLQSMTTRVDQDFVQRLRAGFVTQYELYLTDGLHGDSLFFALADFAASTVPRDADTGHRFDYRAAALAVLCHLFQVCDVFERPGNAAA